MGINLLTLTDEQKKYYWDEYIKAEKEFKFDFDLRPQNNFEEWEFDFIIEMLEEDFNEEELLNEKSC